MNIKVLLAMAILGSLCGIARTVHAEDANAIPSTEGLSSTLSDSELNPHLPFMGMEEEEVKKSSFAAPKGLRVVDVAPVQPNLQLPIEVLVPKSTVESRFPLTTVGDGLWAKIHGLATTNKASIQINDGPWINLNNQTVVVAEPGRSFGGIGGGFGTLTITIPSKDFAIGENIVRWRYNEIGHGIRVIEFNVLSGGKRLIPEKLFSHDDPSRWTAPLTDAASIAAGKKLWESKPIRGITVHCGDCHARDGRDLKYYNFSNRALAAAGQLVGMNELEARQFASYIRTLPLKAPEKARPWNPPYQPGPGLDERPIYEWAAGAGIEAVLERDEDTLPYLLPFKINGTLNAREVPLAVQFPDWRHWLPGIHPIDAFGAKFTSHPFYKQYARIRSQMKKRDAASARLLKTLEAEWFNYAFEFFGRGGKPAVDVPPHPWPVDFQRKVMGAHHWHVVKLWEIMTEFELEDFGKEVFGKQANDRTWLGQRVFSMAPHLMQVENKTVPINGGGPVNWDYFSMAWYQLQVVLNNSNRRNYGTGPIDFGYLNNLSVTPATRNAGMAGVLMVNLITGLQQCETGQGPENTMSGWSPKEKANAHLLVPEGHHANVWRQLSSAQRRPIIEAYLREWITKCESYSPISYYAAGLAKANEIAGTDVMGGKWLDRYWAMTANCKAHGVDPKLITRLANFGKSLWPSNNWEQFKR